MSFAGTLAKYRDFADQRGLPWITPSPLVNRVDHKSFNYSLEEPILREFESYLNITHPYTFSTIQPCIRGADLGQIKKHKTRNHLALFHIFPTAFFLSPEPSSLVTNQKAGIAATFAFLESVGVDLHQLRVSYFAGGSLREISNGHVPVDKAFPSDKTTVSACLESGIESNRLIPTANLDTFVATFEGDEDFFAGFRYEIFHPLPDGTLLEIATGEALTYRQVRENGVTIDVLPAGCSAAPVVIGLERLHCILEGTSRVQAISSLIELSESLRPLANTASEEELLQAANFFCAAHLVLAQTHNSDINKNLAEQRRVIISHLCKLLDKRLPPHSALLDALNHNAGIHPWLPELASEAVPVASALSEHITRRIKQE